MNEQKTLTERYQSYQTDYNKYLNEKLVYETRLADSLEKINPLIPKALEEMSQYPADVETSAREILGNGDLTVTAENLQESKLKWSQLYAYLEDYCSNKLKEAGY
jgi:chaperonin cofactor prefoldin